MTFLGDYNSGGGDCRGGGGREFIRFFLRPRRSGVSASELLDSAATLCAGPGEPNSVICSCFIKRTVQIIPHTAKSQLAGYSFYKLPVTETFSFSGMEDKRKKDKKDKKSKKKEKSLRIPLSKKIRLFLPCSK